MKTKLEPTYGNFEVKGVISQIDEIKTGKTDKTGDEFKSLKIHIKTDKNSSIRVDVFGMKEKEIEIVKFKGKTVDKKKIKWADRNNLEEGWSISNNRALRMGFDIKDAKTKGGLSSCVTYDAITKLSEGFNIGDSVCVSGSMRFSKYENQNGETISMVNYSIQKIFKIEDVDFDNDDFAQYSKFEQTVIIADSEKRDNELLIDGIIVLDKNGNFVRQEFKVMVDKRGVLAKNLSKIPAFSVIPLKGDIINTAIVDESSTDEDNEWGFDSQQPVVTGYERYFEILAADGTAIEMKKYTEDDFLIEDALSKDDDKAFDNEDDKDDSNDDDWLDDEEK